MMRTIRQALRHPIFTIVKQEEEPGVFQIKFGEIPTVITITIWRLEDGRFALDASHGIKTELDATAYWVRHRIYKTPGEALDDFRRAFLIFHYAPAVRAGFRPSESWLVQREA